MGSVHKFKRPQPPHGPRGGKSPHRRLRDWQKSVIAWSAMVLLAAGIWGIARIF